MSDSQRYGTLSGFSAREPLVWSESSSGLLTIQEQEDGAWVFCHDYSSHAKCGGSPTLSEP
jgi:hypothetical protein